MAPVVILAVSGGTAQGAMRDQVGHVPNYVMYPSTI